MCDRQTVIRRGLASAKPTRATQPESKMQNLQRAKSAPLLPKRTQHKVQSSLKMVTQSREKFLSHKKDGTQETAVKKWLNIGQDNNDDNDNENSSTNTESWIRKSKAEKDILLNLAKDKFNAEKDFDFQRRKFLRSQLKRNHVLARKYIKKVELKKFGDGIHGIHGIDNESAHTDALILKVINEYQDETNSLNKMEDSERHKKMLLEMKENNLKNNLNRKKRLLDELKDQQLSDEARRTMMNWIMPGMSLEKKKAHIAKKTTLAWKIGAKDKMFQRATRNLPKFDTVGMGKVVDDLEDLFEETVHL